MNKRIKFAILTIIFILLIGSAYFLYVRIDNSTISNKLIVSNESKQQNNASSSNNSTSSENQFSDKMQAPGFTVYNADGNPVNLSNYVGKPIVLNFWASWCGPCQIEMPDFHKKYLELGDKVTFLMINMTDGSRETVNSASKFIEEKGYTFPVLYDTDSSAAIAYGVYSIPTTYFIDSKGYVIAQAIGSIDGETLQRGMDMIISE